MNVESCEALTYDTVVLLLRWIGTERASRENCHGPRPCLGRAPPPAGSVSEQEFFRPRGFLPTRSIAAAQQHVTWEAHFVTDVGRWTLPMLTLLPMASHISHLLLGSGIPFAMEIQPWFEGCTRLLRPASPRVHWVEG